MTDTDQAPRHDSEFASTVAAFCLRGFAAPDAAAVRAALDSSPLWAKMRSEGTGLWLDTGDVDAIRSLWTREFDALTTNNTLLNKEVQKGIYDALVPEAATMLRTANPDLDEHRIVLEIAFILNAVHGLKLVSTFDADVSVELHTALSRDAAASYAYGKRFAAISPERFIVKVPLTPEGLIAARRLSDDGIRVNFTLGFSARQNYLIGRLARPTWVNVFMGRLNAFVADNGIGDGKNVGEKATLASQRIVRELRSEGIDVHQIGASIRNGEQVHALCGLDVQTIPTGAAAEFVAAAPPLDRVVDRSGDDPDVTLEDASQQDHVAKFWNVSASFRAAVDSIAATSVGGWSGDGIRAALRDEAVFPELDAEAASHVRDDGKIPVLTRWNDRVQSGTASWDGLLSEAALAAFSLDQDALDDRIRGSL